jgi:hypothetical protein
VTVSDDEILDDLFHGCAFEAWLRTAEATGRWPPDSKSVRRLAYALFESTLRAKHEQNPVDSDCDPCHGGTMPTTD